MDSTTSAINRLCGILISNGCAVMAILHLITGDDLFVGVILSVLGWICAQHVISQDVDKSSHGDA